MLHLIVCIKQVPDSREIRIDPVNNTLIRQGVPSIVNFYDLHGLEEALRIKDEHGARVTVVTMGPPPAEKSLKECISLGADEAVLVTDRKFAGADTLATSYVLAKTIEKVEQEWGKADIIFFAESRRWTAIPDRLAPALLAAWMWSSLRMSAKCPK